MQIPIRRCPYCGCTEFVIGYQHHEAMVTYAPNGFLGNRLRHLICRNCGIILLSRVAEPQKYKSARQAW